MEENKKEQNGFFIRFLKNLIHRVTEHNVSAVGAQLAYYLLISIFPFIIFFLNILSFTPLASEPLLQKALVMVPVDIQNLILALVRETVSSSNQTLLSISVITGLWAASKGAMAFIRVMNTAYGVKESRGYIKTRFLSIVFTLALFLSFILVLSTLVFGEIIGTRVFSHFGFAENFIHFWKYFRKLLALIFMIVIFAFLFKFGPAKEEGENRLSFIHTLPGAIFSSVGWVITSLIFSYYVNNFGNFAKTYGSLGGMMALLLWLFMSSVIVVLGGEVNATLKEILNKNNETNNY